MKSCFKTTIIHGFNQSCLDSLSESLAYNRVCITVIAAKFCNSKSEGDGGILLKLPSKNVTLADASNFYTLQDFVFTKGWLYSAGNGVYDDAGCISTKKFSAIGVKLEVTIYNN